ncbi:MAG: PLP-dependent aminotransferase family protein [Polyangiaceae bacterium]
MRVRAVITVEDGASPLFLRIARGIGDDVTRGRLRAGDPLPGTRALAVTLGINRNTVVAAYHELVAEGWAVARPGGGTFVADVPAQKPRAFARDAGPARIASEPAFALRSAARDPRSPRLAPGTLVLSGGTPDVRLVDRAVLARALRHAVMARGATDLLAYGDSRGDPRLRAALANLARDERGVPACADNVLVVSGSQMALELTARAVLRSPAPSAGAIAVEAVGYRAAWSAFERAGARVVPVPVDEAGMDVDALGELTRREPIRAVYVTPHHQCPTMATLGRGRRLALLALARREGFAIIEDDYDHELHYEGRPILPLASADRHGSVIYVGTLSKVLAPGLRLGYVIAPQPVVECLARDRFLVDRQGDQIVERAAAELIEDGAVARHVRRVRRIYMARRDLLVDELERGLPGHLHARRPAGGLSLWARVRLRPSLVACWERRALELGVAFAAGQRFMFDGSAIPFARFGFASSNETELREAVRRLVRAFPRGPRRGA